MRRKQLNTKNKIKISKFYEVAAKNMNIVRNIIIYLYQIQFPYLLLSRRE